MYVQSCWSVRKIEGDRNLISSISVNNVVKASMETCGVCIRGG